MGSRRASDSRVSPLSVQDTPPPTAACPGRAGVGVGPHGRGSSRGPSPGGGASRSARAGARGPSSRRRGLTLCAGQRSWAELRRRGPTAPVRAALAARQPDFSGVRHAAHDRGCARETRGRRRGGRGCPPRATSPCRSRARGPRSPVDGRVCATASRRGTVRCHTPRSASHQPGSPPVPRHRFAPARRRGTPRSVGADARATRARIRCVPRGARGAPDSGAEVARRFDRDRPHRRSRGATRCRASQPQTAVPDTERTERAPRSGRSRHCREAPSTNASGSARRAAQQGGGSLLPPAGRAAPLAGARRRRPGSRG